MRTELRGSFVAVLTALLIGCGSPDLPVSAGEDGRKDQANGQNNGESSSGPQQTHPGVSMKAEEASAVLPASVEYERVDLLSGRPATFHLVSQTAQSAQFVPVTGRKEVFAPSDAVAEFELLAESMTIPGVVPTDNLTDHLVTVRFFDIEGNLDAQTSLAEYSRSAPSTIRGRNGVDIPYVQQATNLVETVYEQDGLGVWISFANVSQDDIETILQEFDIRTTGESIAGN